LPEEHGDRAAKCTAGCYKEVPRQIQCCGHLLLPSVGKIPSLPRRLRFMEGVGPARVSDPFRMAFIEYMSSRNGDGLCKLSRCHAPGVWLKDGPSGLETSCALTNWPEVLQALAGYAASALPNRKPGKTLRTCRIGFVLPSIVLSSRSTRSF
jgi:hypothetical protein